MIEELERELDRLAREIKSDINSLDLEDIVSISIELAEEQRRAQEKFEQDNCKGGKDLRDLLREMRYAEKLESLLESLKVFEDKINDSESVSMGRLINGVIDSHEILESVKHYAPIEVENE